MDHVGIAMSSRVGRAHKSVFRQSYGTRIAVLCRRMEP